MMRKQRETRKGFGKPNERSETKYEQVRELNSDHRKSEIYREIENRNVKREER
jgi:hypothetical protein